MSNSYYEKGMNDYVDHQEFYIDTVNGGGIWKLLITFLNYDAEVVVVSE